MVFVGGTLPCGRFYYETVDGFFGNAVLRLSYEYLYLYLGFLAHVLERGELWVVALPAAVSEPEAVGPAPSLPDAWIALFEWRERFVEAIAAMEGTAAAWADRVSPFEPANYTPVEARMQDWPLLAAEPTAGILENYQVHTETALLLQHAWCARPYRYSPHTFVILPQLAKGEEGPAPRITLGELLGPAPRVD